MAWYNYIPGIGALSGIVEKAPKLWSGIKQGLSWLGDKASNLWDDYTGKSLAKYQQEMQEEMYEKYQSPAAMMRQFKEAGLNPNLVYGSAGAGIGHAPSYDASNVMRGSEKVNSVLSALSQVLGLKQAMYSTEAAREASEQSAIKTLSDRVGLAEKEGNLRLKNSLFGVPLFDDLYVRRRKGADTNIGTGSAYGGYMGNYIRAYRSNELNSLYRSQFQNVADYGLSATPSGLKIDNYFGTPSVRIRNATNSLKYRLQSEIGNLGTYGKLIISLFDLLK